MNTFVIKLRSIARRTGMLRLVHRMRAVLWPNQNYEERFQRALHDNVKPGDVVWDIGANVGIYTELFCKWVGPEGRVVAFEPNPEPAAQIRSKLPDCHWLFLENVALGSQEQVSTLVVGEVSSASGHLHYESSIDSSGKSLIPVQVTTGDKVCGRIGHIPNVMKIDVEGFEEEVLLGLDHTLSSPVVRAVLIEVHFRELESRGQPTAPIRIERLLKSKGFRIIWVDASHLLANRLAQP